MFRAITSIFLVLLLSGCTTNWINEAKTEQEFYQDNGYCMEKAQKVREMCMMDKGWSETGTPQWP